MNALLLAAVLAQAAPAAPAPQAMRADVHFVAGWQNLRHPQEQNSYNDWLNGIFYGGAGAGWYWNDHLKTQVDFGGGTWAEQYRYRDFVVGGGNAFEASRLSLRQDSVAIGQQYQFFRNQWFHPHVGVGADIARETSRTEFQAVTIVDPVTHQSRTIREAQTGPDEHRIITRPFAEAGFKAYMTRRAFFTGDMRVMFRHGIDEVLFRTGFGIDF